MDYIKEAENYLHYYMGLKKSVAHAKYMMEKLAYCSRPGNLSAMRIDLTGVSVRRQSDVLQEVYELQRWQDIYQESAETVEHIENLLAGLDDRESKVLDMWYIQKMDKTDIAEELNYSHRQSVYELRDRAIKKFSVALFGLDALRAI